MLCSEGLSKAKTMKLRMLSKADVQEAITMGQAVEIVRQAFVQLSTGQAVVPIRIHLPVERHKGVTLFMPAYLAESDELGVKIASIFPHNPNMGIPTVFALVFVLAPATGRPLAVMDGTCLTALRTGAASGVATDLLARKDARVAAIFGAGAEGRTQLEAICQVRDIRKVWVYDIRPEVAERYVREMKGRGGRVPKDIAVASSPAQAIQEADVICTATTSNVPVFEDFDLKSGVHINAVGAFTSEMQEIPEKTVVRAKVVVDSLEACLADGTGDLIIPLRKGLVTKDHIYAELGEIAMGAKGGRESDSEITLFKTVGNAVQDVAVAVDILGAAEKKDLGSEIEI